MLAAKLLDDNYCYTVLNVQRVYGVWTLIVNFEGKFQAAEMRLSGMVQCTHAETYIDRGGARCTVDSYVPQARNTFLGA